MFAMFFNVVFAVFVCYPAAFCQLCFYNKDWIDWIGLDCHQRASGAGGSTEDQNCWLPASVLGPQSLSAAGPSLWNTLPSDTKLSTVTAASFCSQPKTVMFARSNYIRISAVVIISIIRLA